MIIVPKSPDYDFLILMAWSGRVGVGGVGVKVSPDLW